MDSLKLPSKHSKKGDVFPFDFFGALNRSDDDAALAYLRAEALPDGDVPSPRAAELMKSGEWDSQQRLSLVYVNHNACAGKIGNDGYRFCGKPVNFCQAAIHTKNTIGKIVRGWYISLGKTQGVLSTPFLPAEEDGGPLKPTGAGRLADSDNPFRLTRGQWKFIIDSWYAVNADDPSDELSTSSAIERVKGATPDILTEAGLDIPLDSGKDSSPSPFSFGDEELPELAGTPTSSVETDDKKRINELENQVLLLMRMKEDSDSKLNDFLARFQTLQSTMNAKVQQLENVRVTLARNYQIAHERLQLLENSANLGGSIGMLPEQLDKLEELDRAVLGPQGAFANLRLQFTQFKEKVESGGGLECNGISFGSKRELISWFEEKGPPIEIFLDGLAYLHAIRPAVVYQDEASRQRESQIKTSMNSYLQVAFFTSFDTIIPSVLVAGKRMTDTGGSVYDWLRSNLKTFEVWKPKGGQTHGVGQMILDGVSRVTSRVAETRGLHTADPQATLLSTGLCHDSAQFCNELVRFITEQQDAMTADTIYTHEQIWQLNLECLQTIIEELSEAREAVADAARFQPAYYLWGVLKAWQIQQRYLSNHFKNDPALNGILIRRLLRHGEDTSVKERLAKIDKVDNKVDEHRRQEMAEIKKIKDMITELKKH